ncbi:predicted protein [Naegleria gruberi]|uniref:Predicted protein n=1 Tax=Naegleria gruberi TaxID=5762 RepID=D2VZH5_NAEGR|nr:uncharacterized protein NAEGRDRAFT_74490 [Naegleria gruberi]EFC37792.1 predicted protein [Naegleria gruberi]|eukprot:XP_002670536.1 predicted protein [Naegleria gruberi strain NEG-M]
MKAVRCVNVCCLLLLAIVSAMMLLETSVGKDVKFCMPPQATFWETTKDASYIMKEFKNNDQVIKNQYNVKTSQQRQDFIVKGNVVKSEISIQNPMNNDTIVYTLTSDNGDCSCMNFGPSDSSVFVQCHTLPILEKGSIAGINALKIGYNQSDLYPTWTEINYYWVVPAKESGYWWFLSRTSYVIDDSNNVQLGTTTYYNQEDKADPYAFYLPKYCPHYSQCTNPRKNKLFLNDFHIWQFTCQSQDELNFAFDLEISVLHQLYHLNKH